MTDRLTRALYRALLVWLPFSIVLLSVVMVVMCRTLAAATGWSDRIDSDWIAAAITGLVVGAIGSFADWATGDMR